MKGGSTSRRRAGTPTVDDDEVEYTVKVEDRKTDRRSQEDAAYDALKVVFERSSGKRSVPSTRSCWPEPTEGRDSLFDASGDDSRSSTRLDVMVIYSDFLKSPRPFFSRSSIRAARDATPTHQIAVFA